MKGVRRPLIPFNINFGSRVAKLVDPSKEAWRSMRTCQQYLDGPDTSLYPAPKRRQELQLVRSAHQILHVDHARVSDYGARHKTRLAQMGASDAGLCLRLGGLREDKAAEEVDVIELGAVDWVAGLAEGTGSTPGKGEENRIAWGGDGDVCADTFNNAGT